MPDAVGAGSAKQGVLFDEAQRVGDGGAMTYTPDSADLVRVARVQALITSTTSVLTACN
jgi:hypothetical protein